MSNILLIVYPSAIITCNDHSFVDDKITNKTIVHSEAMKMVKAS